MLKGVDAIEKLVVRVLVILLLTCVVMGTLGLGTMVVQEAIDPPYLSIEIGRLFEMFSLFLVVLVGIELLRAVKGYLIHGDIKPEIVIEAAIIAVGNKLITLDIKHVAPEMLLGLAAILIGLAAVYFILRRSDTAA